VKWLAAADSSIGSIGSPGVRRWLLRVVILLAGLLAATSGAALVLYRASQNEPEFYRQVLSIDHAALQEASDQMLQRTTALASDLKKPGSWEIAFSDKQINGWLAVDLPKNHPDLLPPEIRDPRVVINGRRMRVACRLAWDRWHGVAWLEVQPSLVEPNLLAVRICRVRLGAVPVPRGWVLDQLTRAALRLRLRIRWNQLDGDPVLLVPLDEVATKGRKRVTVRQLHLQDSHVYLAGVTE